MTRYKTIMQPNGFRFSWNHKKCARFFSNHALFSRVFLVVGIVSILLASCATQVINPTLEQNEPYRKISKSGKVLDDSAKVWACVEDKRTGLIWEIKTDDDGLHDKDNRYRWGSQGTSKIALSRRYLGNNKREERMWDGKGKHYVDGDKLVDGSNHEKLCGYDDWRIPTLLELTSLVYCSHGAYDLDTGCTGKTHNRKDFQRPTINTRYFPNIVHKTYWSSSPNMDDDRYAWSVNFYSGHDYLSPRFIKFRLRLVRARQ